MPQPPRGLGKVKFAVHLIFKTEFDSCRHHFEVKMFATYFNETHDEARCNINEWEAAGSFPREIYNLAGDADYLQGVLPKQLGL